MPLPATESQQSCASRAHPAILENRAAPESRSFLYESVRSTFEKCLAILKKKNGDYARTESEFLNFETVQRLGVPVQMGIMIRLLDKITRLENLMTHAPYVTEESFEDTAADAINYLAILIARRDFEKATKSVSAT